MEKLKTFEESIDFFKNIATKSNEYSFKINGVKISGLLHTICNEKLHTHIGKTEDGDKKGIYIVVEEEAITRFHPNTINNKAFWVKAKSAFPYLSVCGQKVKSFKEANSKTLEMSEHFGMLGMVKEIINLNLPERLSVLEIGFGYGGFFKEVKDMCFYNGIDYTKPKFLTKFDELIEIDKSGIPEILYKKNFYNIVYSVNVLQHCSQQDRFEYFKQIGEVLKSSGVFLFSSFVITNKNKETRLFGVRDSKGRGYTHFFNQLTEVDYYEEIVFELEKNGFIILSNKISENVFSCVAKKK